MGDRDNFTPSVVFRQTLTPEDYDEAILVLHQAKLQPGQLPNGCTICMDSGHTAENCQHNPLVLARKWVAATSIYRCFHCGYVALNEGDARAHFGNADDELARCVRLRAEERHHGGRELHNAVTLGFHASLVMSVDGGVHQVVPDQKPADLALLAASFPGAPPVVLIATLTAGSGADRDIHPLDDTAAGLIEIWTATVAFVLNKNPDSLVWLTRNQAGQFNRMARDWRGRGEYRPQPVFVHGHRARSEEAFRAAFGDTAAYLLARLGGLQQLKQAYNTGAQP